MMEIQERMLEYIDEVYESTGGGFPTAGMVARAVGAGRADGYDLSAGPRS
jgi:hypothetical protein